MKEETLAGIFLAVTMAVSVYSSYVLYQEYTRTTPCTQESPAISINATLVYNSTSEATGTTNLTVLSTPGPCVPYGAV